MSMICVNGSKECTGCMACYEKVPIPICSECNREITEEVYEDEYNAALCEECLLTLHKKED